MEPTDQSAGFFLSEGETLFLAREWERRPDLLTQPLTRDDKKIEVTKDQEVMVIKKYLGKVPGYENLVAESLRHADDWQKIEVDLTDFVNAKQEETFRTEAVNPELLDQQLKELNAKKEADLKVIEQRKTRWKNRVNDLVRMYSREGEHEVDETTVDGLETEVDKEFAKESAAPETIQTTGGVIERVTIPQKETVVVTEVKSQPGGHKYQPYSSPDENKSFDWHHPFDSVGPLWNNFKSVFSGRAQSTTQVTGRQLAGKTVEVASSGMGKVALGASAGVAKKAALGAGLKMLAGTAMTAASGLLTGGLGWLVKAGQLLLNGNFLRDLGSKLKILGGAALTWFLIHPIAMGAGLIGGMAGFVVGGPIGAAIGFGVGYSLGSMAEGLLGIGGTGGGVFSGTTATTASSFGSLSVGSAFGGAAGPTATAGGSLFGGITGGSLGAFTSSATGTVLLGVGGVSAGTLLVVTTVGAGFLASPQTVSEVNGPEPLVFVQKRVDKSFIPDLTPGQTDTIKYSLTITAGPDKDINVTVIDNLTLEGKANKNLPAPTRNTSYPTKLAKGTSVTVDFADYTITSDFNDSSLSNIVTVNATVDGSQEIDKQSASAITTIGSPQLEQPFGFPASGKVVALDQTYWQSNRQHRGTWFTSSGTRYWVPGGMDIAKASGNEPVYSTVKGIVIFSKFDLGDPAMAGKCTNISEIPIGSIFSNCAVGGTTIIQSGNFTIEYLHLANNLLPVGSQVNRGYQIGVTYAGDQGGIPTVDGWHVHYQIQYKGTNYNFVGAPTGKCSQGAVLPNMPNFGDIVAAATSKTCD